MMKLDLQSLRIFVSAIESKSLTKAAEENDLATSGASKRIADLESRLGVDLLTRHARGVQGTPAGLSLYHHAIAILRRVEIAQDVVAEFGKAGDPKIRLAANPSSIIAYIPPLARKYLTQSPATRIDLQERYSYDIPRLVAENEADVGIYHALSPAPGVTSYPFHRDRIALVTRRDHPLARFDELFLEAASSYSFVGYFPRHTYDAFSSLAGRSLPRPLDVKIEVGNYEARCRLIQEGIGIGVIPEPNAAPYLNLYNLKSIKLLDEWAERQLYVCVSNDRDLSDYPETKRFLDFLLIRPD
ncbi:LysR family transcriptional regulator [Burkholderia gladioli]|uniref:LysR family transcriptional regulator n=1 Tax=Burkholderia gladioli TaxID=28095 RepID=UPI0016407A98|nr:LysR family transcriptional regulator [Burkholderia gladioli]